MGMFVVTTFIGPLMNLVFFLICQLSNGLIINSRLFKRFSELSFNHEKSLDIGFKIMVAICIQTSYHKLNIYANILKAFWSLKLL